MVYSITANLLLKGYSITFDETELWVGTERYLSGSGSNTHTNPNLNREKLRHTRGSGHITGGLALIIDSEPIPPLIIYSNSAQVSIKYGGLGILYPSHIAAPYFVITMTNTMQFIKQGVRYNKDLEHTRICSTIASLYYQEFNPQSRILRIFYTLLPQGAKVATPPNTPDDEQTHNFLHRTSASRARLYIKDLYRRQIEAKLYVHVQNECPEHLKHL